jgi:hypothetical protein
VVALVCLLALALSPLGASGCAASEDPVTVIVYLRDDAAIPDVDALATMLRSDGRVMSPQYVHENVMLAEESAAAAGPATDGPEADPASRAWLEFESSADSLDDVLAAIESDPMFSRTVLVPLDGDWWQVR